MFCNTNIIKPPPFLSGILLTPVISRCSVLAVHPLQFLAVFPTIPWRGIQVKGALALTWSPNAGHAVWGVVVPWTSSPHPPGPDVVGVTRALQRLRWWWRASVMLVGMLIAAAVMATTMMATMGSCCRRLAGAGGVIVHRALGHSLLPGAFQYLQLQALLAATASERHPSLPGDCVNPGWLHCDTLWASGDSWVLCREATLNRESTFGGTQRCWRLKVVDQRLRLLMSTRIRLAGLSYRKTVWLWRQIVVMQAADVWRVAVLAREGVRQ